MTAGINYVSVKIMKLILDSRALFDALSKQFINNFWFFNSLCCYVLKLNRFLSFRCHPSHAFTRN